MNRTGRAGIVVVLVVSLLLAAVTRNWAQRLRTDRNVAGGNTGTSLASMNSFALALLLGGLRGPLVMFLWTSSENLKNEKNLEDFDTYVEWIRLLQPEFDSVHIFQVWNKAYNISVQLAALANKYTTILDAIEYASRVEAQRPNNVNMIYQIASIYFDKLGSAQEKNYYKKRVREESRPHAARQKLARSDPGWRRLELDPVLDDNGMILPELLAPRYPRPANLPPGSEWNNGAELQYLEKYHPFPYGVSAFAFAYNYHKQAQVLQEVGKQFHATLSAAVVDSRPGLALKGWSEDEWERGRRLELAASNVALPEERIDMELPTANIAVDAPLTDPSLLPEAIYSYDRAVRLSIDAIEEYKRHLLQHGSNFQPYQSHMDELSARQPLLLADRDYLKAMSAPAAERPELLAAAAKNYREAIKRNLQIIFRYYVPDPVAQGVLPPGMTRADISGIPADQQMALYEKTLQEIQGLPFDAEAEDRGEFRRYVDRSQARLNRIGK